MAGAAFDVALGAASGAARGTTSGAGAGGMGEAGGERTSRSNAAYISSRVEAAACYNCIFDTLVALPCCVVLSKINRQLRKDVDAINIFAPLDSK